MARDGATSAFAGEPQPVEVFHRGRWYAGELLGWRHDEDGRCWARVRVVVGRLRHSAWVDLADLRLPGSAPAAVAPRQAPPQPVRPTEPSDTQPHLLLPRPGGRPPVPRRAPVPPAVVPSPATVPPPALPAPRGRRTPAPGVPTTLALPLPDAVPVG